MTHPADSDGAADRPPQRRRWLRWIVGGLVLAVVLVTLLLGAGWLARDIPARRAREAAVARLRALGAPINRQEWASRFEDIPDSRNAAIPLSRAGVTIDRSNRTFEAYNNLPTTVRLPRPTDESPPSDERVREIIHQYSGSGNPYAGPVTQAEAWAVLERFVAEHAEVLALAAEADALLPPNVEDVEALFSGQNGEGIPKGERIISIWSEGHSAQLPLSKLTLGAAMLAADERHWEDVFTLCRRVMGQAMALEAQPYSMVGNMSANSGWQRASSDLVDLLLYGELDPRTVAEDQPLRGDVEQLIDLLLQDQGPRASLRWSLENEAAMQQDAIDALLAGEEIEGPNGRLAAFLSRPSYNASGALLGEISAELLEAMQPEVPRTLPELREALSWKGVEDDPRLSEQRYMWAYLLLPSLGLIELHYTSLAHRRLSAIMLATLLWQADHEGQLPPTLEALVPRYLPAVPIDPLAESATIQYDASRGIAWSVGKDGINAHGSLDVHAPKSRRRPQSPVRAMAVDLVVPLTPRAAQEVRTTLDQQAVPALSPEEQFERTRELLEAQGIDVH